jgi:hypothetical protein
VAALFVRDPDPHWLAGAQRDFALGCFPSGLQRRGRIDDVGRCDAVAVHFLDMIFRHQRAPKGSPTDQRAALGFVAATGATFRILELFSALANSIAAAAFRPGTAADLGVLGGPRPLGAGDTRVRVIAMVSSVTSQNGKRRGAQSARPP